MCVNQKCYIIFLKKSNNSLKAPWLNSAPPWRALWPKSPKRRWAPHGRPAQPSPPWAWHSPGETAVAVDDASMMLR